MGQGQVFDHELWVSDNIVNTGPCTSILKCTCVPDMHVSYGW